MDKQQRYHITGMYVGDFRHLPLDLWATWTFECIKGDQEFGQLEFDPVCMSNNHELSSGKMLCRRGPLWHYTIVALDCVIGYDVNHVERALWAGFSLEEAHLNKKNILFYTDSPWQK